MYNVWGWTRKTHGWILSANFPCMTGLGSTCSHVAGLLFKIAKAIHVRETNDTSHTSGSQQKSQQKQSQLN